MGRPLMIQFDRRDSDEVRLQKLNRLAEQLAAGDQPGLVADQERRIQALEARVAELESA